MRHVKVVKYTRRSTAGDEDKNYSIANQREEIDKWIARQDGDLVLVQSYNDPGGKSYRLDRIVLKQLFADARARKFDTVLVGRWDRFSRMQNQQAVAIGQLEQYGVKGLSVTEPTAEGALGTAQRNLYAFGAELELINLRARTTGGKRARVQSGKLPPMARARYGYLFGDGSKAFCAVDPEAAPVVRRIYDLYLGGMSLRAIVALLTRERVPTPSQLQATRGQAPKGQVAQKGWHRMMVQRILTNPTYVGRGRGWATTQEQVFETDPYSGEVIERVRRVKRAADDPEVVEYGPDVCPLLVSEDAFTAVQQMMGRAVHEAPGA
jgi:site-specific DNA recombinase